MTCACSSHPGWIGQRSKFDKPDAIAIIFKKICRDLKREACFARAADTADALLNQEFTGLQDAVKAAAAEMEVRPEAQLDMLKDAQRKWIGFRDDTCNFEDSLAFGATATGGYLSSCICALSYERINDFDRIRHSILGR